MMVSIPHKTSLQVGIDGPTAHDSMLLGIFSRDVQDVKYPLPTISPTTERQSFASLDARLSSPASVHELSNRADSGYATDEKSYSEPASPVLGLSSCDPSPSASSTPSTRQTSRSGSPDTSPQIVLQRSATYEEPVHDRMPARRGSLLGATVLSPSSPSYSDRSPENDIRSAEPAGKDPITDIRHRSLEWVKDHCETLQTHIIETEAFRGTHRVREQCVDHMRGMKIYQSLTVYAFLHLMHCVKDEKLLSLFKKRLDEWKHWNIIRCLTHHRDIHDGLFTLLREAKGVSPLCQSHMGDEVDGSKLPELDAQIIAHQLAAILDDTDPGDRTHKDIFHLSGADAQSMVDLMHALLEDPAVDHDLKILFADASIKLTKRTTCYPACLVLNDIKMDSSNPIVGSSLSDIYKGYIKGRPIAVKKTRAYELEPEKLLTVLKACANEGIIWSRLSHPNLLPFYGISYMDADSSRICFVSPWIDHGHIGQYLEKFPQTDRNPLVMDIAQGIEYLHTCVPAVIHGDLKPPNIFVTPSGTACLADFGLSYARDPLRRVATSSQGPGHGGTYPYQAPEILLLDGQVTFAGDIYAFACVLYELFSGKRPFHRQTVAGVIRALNANERPHKPAEASELMWGLIQSCWHQDPLQRPSASNVVRRLRSFVDVDEQRRQHQWDDGFRMTIRRTYSLTDHPLSHLAAPS
ncbi:kinase-like protein [Leucogyrophana mollusca]|uniref:Kinase-like protein n=1 Tax=Leucogyrophana mollusca TaxID=85980 RepID=A0ACB8BAF9_9AGAM|nr:kinase-like protein [Leucogyrophana mollusca]